jgi:hypothetical protein
VEGAFLIPYLDGHWGDDGLYYPDHEIYMRPFEGYETYDETGDLMVYLLVKSMYGLVQAALSWSNELVRFFNAQNFRQCITDPCTFIKKDTAPGEYLAVPVLVDDMVPTGKPQRIIDEFLEQLGAAFKIKRLGVIQWFSGIQIRRDSDHTYLCQSAYADQLVKKWGVQTCNPTDVPLQPGEDMFKLTQADPNPILHDQTEVQSLASGIGWIVECTRPDLMFARMSCSRMQQTCSESSWKLMKNVLKYVKTTRSFGIRYSRGTEFPNTLITFVDASLHTCSITGRAAYCILIFLNGGLVFWRSKLLSGKPSSSTLEAEYPASHYATNETVYFRQYMYEINFPQDGPTIIYGDNAAATQLASTDRVTHDNRHINMKYHAMRWSREQGITRYEHVPSAHNPADIGTKIMRDKAAYLRFAMTVCYDCLNQLTEADIP